MKRTIRDEIEVPAFRRKTGLGRPDGNEHAAYRFPVGWEPAEPRSWDSPGYPGYWEPYGPVVAVRYCRDGTERTRVLSDKASDLAWKQCADEIAEHDAVDPYEDDYRCERWNEWD